MEPLRTSHTIVGRAKPAPTVTESFLDYEQVGFGSLTDDITGSQWFTYNPNTQTLAIDVSASGFNASPTTVELYGPSNFGILTNSSLKLNAPTNQFSASASTLEISGNGSTGIMNTNIKKFRISRKEKADLTTGHENANHSRSCSNS